MIACIRGPADGSSFFVNGVLPCDNCLALFAVIVTNSKRLSTFSNNSSTVGFTNIIFPSFFIFIIFLDMRHKTTCLCLFRSSLCLSTGQRSLLFACIKLIVSVFAFAKPKTIVYAYSEARCICPPDSARFFIKSSCDGFWLHC